jgi:glycosyltransferase involved in cell wall biosynthesis
VPGLPPAFPFQPAWRRRETAVYRGASAIFTMSENVKRSLVAVYGVDPGRIVVAGAGPNVVPRAPAGAPPPEKHPLAFLFVGKTWAAKGGPELLRAFARVRAAFPQAELWCVGAQHPPVAPPGVTFFGALGHDRLHDLFARATAFVLPTLREAFGLALLEAMAFRLPCIASNVEAIPEIVEDGVTGFLVPPRDPVMLSRAMLTLAGDRELARDMGEEGAEKLEEQFGWDRAAATMWDRMDALVARRAPLRVVGESA